MNARADAITHWKKHFDKDGDGIIGWEEFKGAMNLLIDQNEPERIRTVHRPTSTHSQVLITFATSHNIPTSHNIFTSQ